MGKPFLTIEEQIELLERRGVSRTDGERCALMREGHYSIIDGYKEPFREPVVTKDDLSDRYKVALHLTISLPCSHSIALCEL